KLYNPLAIYRFLDAATKSLTVDSQLGGITGLYDLGESLRAIPTKDIAFFTVPNFPRGEVVPGDTANVLWTQPEDDEIFQAFQADVPASASLFTSPQSAAPDVAAPSAAGGASTGGTGAAGAAPDGADATSPAATATPGATGTPDATATPGGTVSPRATVSPTTPAVSLQARTANQSICAG
ncbi:MAG TPA: hypothetical protein VI365_29150, partial [Trebonia sp.]